MPLGMSSTIVLDICCQTSKSSHVGDFINSFIHSVIQEVRKSGSQSVRNSGSWSVSRSVSQSVAKQRTGILCFQIYLEIKFRYQIFLHSENFAIRAPTNYPIMYLDILCFLNLKRISLLQYEMIFRRPG